MVRKIEADGLIIHINPLQEWFQPEGDRFENQPIVTLTKFLDKCTYPVIVKEVGHGFGPRSIGALMKLPLKAIEFGAFGGTNFYMLESKRGKHSQIKQPFVYLGHTAEEMVQTINALPMSDKAFIISGGVHNILDAHFLMSQMKSKAIIGMASPFLKPAMESFEVLENFFLEIVDSLLVAKGLLQIKAEK